MVPTGKLVGQARWLHLEVNLFNYLRIKALLFRDMTVSLLLWGKESLHHLTTCMWSVEVVEVRTRKRRISIGRDIIVGHVCMDQVESQCWKMAGRGLLAVTGNMNQVGRATRLEIPNLDVRKEFKLLTTLGIWQSLYGEKVELQAYIILIIVKLKS